MSPPSSEPLDVSGHCYCGAVRFAVRMPAGQEPIFAAYCHCDSCRRAHAAPLYHVVCIEASMFQITSGEGGLTEFSKPGTTIPASLRAQLLKRPQRRAPLGYRFAAFG